MIVFRECLAVLIFLAGLSGPYSFIMVGFDWSAFFAMVLCFVLAYLIWPSKRRGQRDEGAYIADILEWMIELPIDVFLWILRLFGRLFGGKGNGTDIDFDI
jgi:hypothetical protein